jgi:hypothetical protein
MEFFLNLKSLKSIRTLIKCVIEKKLDINNFDLSVRKIDKIITEHFDD